MRMVRDPEQVTGELRFWITVAASKDVRVEPLADGSLVEPSEGVAGEGDSDEESDHDYENARAALLVEPQYPEHAWGGFCVKGEARERRATRQIIAACAKAGVKYEDPEFACDESMLSRDAGSALWYMYVCMYVYIYIYIHISICFSTCILHGYTAYR